MSFRKSVGEKYCFVKTEKHKIIDRFLVEGLSPEEIDRQAQEMFDAWLNRQPNTKEIVVYNNERKECLEEILRCCVDLEAVDANRIVGTFDGHGIEVRLSKIDDGKWIVDVMIDGELEGVIKFV